MSSVSRNILVGTGNAADYVDQINGPLTYCKDLGTEMRASTTTKATIMLALSTVYSDLVAAGFGNVNTNVTSNVNQFFIGLSSGVFGPLYKAPNSSAGLLDYSSLSTTNRVLGYMFCPQGGTVHYRTLSDGTNNGLVDFENRTVAVMDNATASVGSISRPGGGNAPHRIVIPAQKYATYDTKLICNTLTLEVTTSGQNLTFKLRRSTETGVSEHNNPAALAASMAAQIGAPSDTQIDTTTFTVTGMTAAQYLQAHPYFFIQWPLTNIGLNLHHCHTLVSP